MAQLAAIGAGVLSHSLFNRREPSPRSFLTSLVALTAGTFLYIGRSLPLVDGVLATLQLLAVYLATLAASIALYRLGPFHPLAGVPGPPLAKLTQLYTTAYVTRGTTRLQIRRLHQVYGDIVRIGPNEVSVCRSDTILQLTGAHSWIKGISYDVTLSGGGAVGAPPSETSLISFRDHGLHAGRRKYWDRAFAANALRGYQKAIVERLAQFCDLLDARKGQVIDLHKYMGFFVYDVLTDLAYGGGGRMLEDGEDKEDVLHTLSEAFNYSGIVKAAPWIGIPGQWLGLGGDADRFRDFAKRSFIRRIKEGRAKAEPDIFMHLLGEETEKGAARLSERELASDSALVIAAGADTTRTVLSTIFMYMLREPWRFKQLQTELDNRLGSSSSTARVDVPTHDDLTKIALLDAYINESLRLNPPLPFAIQREAPKEGQVLVDRAVPGGTQVRLAIYAIHRDPRYFPDPDTFKPERWLSKDDSECNREAFTPFIYGPYVRRSCPGKAFAYQEMRLVLATVLRRYDLAEAPGFNSVAFEKSFVDRAIVDIPTPFRVVLTPRK